MMSRRMMWRKAALAAGMVLVTLALGSSVQAATITITTVESYQWNNIDPPTPSTGGVCDGSSTVTIEDETLNMTATPSTAGTNPQLTISLHGQSSLDRGYGVFSDGETNFDKDEINAGERVAVLFDRDVLVTAVSTQWWDANGTWALAYDGKTVNATGKKSGNYPLTDILPAGDLTTIGTETGLLLDASTVGGRNLALLQDGPAGEEGRWQGISLAIVIPEPATLALAAVGLLGLRRRRRRA